MTGTGGLLRFMVRRERFSLPLWLLGMALLVAVQSMQSQQLYGSADALARLRQTIGGNTAVIAMSGPTRLLGSVGGEVVFEIFPYAVVVLALLNMFLIGRHTRAEEEAGRAELLRSARVGRVAPLAAALMLAGLADLAAGALVFAVAAGTGLPVGGSVLFGMAVAAVGCTFAAITAVAAQVFENSRAAYGMVALLLGAAYVVRAAGDVGGGGLSWASPIGWGQRTFPYVDDRWWPLLVPLAATMLLVPLAVAQLRRRDLGAGLVPTRPGRSSAAPALRNAYALAWRLQRAGVAGWAVGLLLLGAAYGSIGNSIEQYVRDYPEVAEFLPGGVADIADGYIALTAAVSALLVAAFGVASMLRLRAEETSGRAEPVLATATGRLTWLAGQLSVALGGSALVLLAYGVGSSFAYGLAVADAAQVPRLIAVALAYLPAVWLVIAVAVLAVGWLPRWSAAIAWFAVAYCAVVALFADSFGLPGWTQRASPFAHTPRVPLADPNAVPLVVLVLLIVLLIGFGQAGLRRRDLG